MKIYMVIEKTFFVSHGKEYQVADALQPITVYSNYKKVNEAFEDYKRTFELQGFKPTGKYRQLFPVEHMTFTNKKLGYRKVLYILEEVVQ